LRDSIGFGYRGELETVAGVHLRNREFAGLVAAFQSLDPLDGVIGTSTLVNGYHYAGNDPVDAIDPLGLRSLDRDLLPTAPVPNGADYAMDNRAVIARLAVELASALDRYAGSVLVDPWRLDTIACLPGLFAKCKTDPRVLEEALFNIQMMAPRDRLMDFAVLEFSWTAFFVNGGGELMGSRDGDLLLAPELGVGFPKIGGGVSIRASSLGQVGTPEVGATTDALRGVSINGELSSNGLGLTISKPIPLDDPLAVFGSEFTMETGYTAGTGWGGSIDLSYGVVVGDLGGLSWRI
jgi:RHS repeat-associated protein